MTNSRIKALLIEDNPGYVRLAREALSEARGLRIELESVAQLAGGLERLAKGGVDVVLLDLGLPDSSGLETFLRVREAAGAVPIVVLTGLEDDEFAAEAVRKARRISWSSAIWTATSWGARCATPSSASGLKASFARHRGWK
jgi:DNA-binding NarL/FixJ family response regulator